MADTCTCEKKTDFERIIIDHQKVKKYGYEFFVIMSVFEPYLIVNLAIAKKILQHILLASNLRELKQYEAARRNSGRNFDRRVAPAA